MFAEVSAQSCANLLENDKSMTVKLPRANLTTKEVHEQLKTFSHLANAPKTIEWTALPDGSLDYYNSHWFRYTGLTLEQTRGSGWVKVVHPDDISNSMSTWTRALASGQKFEFEHRLLRADGRYRWHRGAGMPLHNEEGKIIKWFGIVLDMHDQNAI
jgi:hypothetical protein